MTKVLVTLLYYDRPNMLLDAIDSLIDQTTNDFRVAFVDDGSKHRGIPIICDKLYNMGIELYCYRSECTPEDKLLGKIECGRLLNQAIKDATDCDIVVPFNEDDALFPDYLEKLIKYYDANPNIPVSYCYFKDWYPYSYSRKTGYTQEVIDGASVDSNVTEVYDQKKLLRKEFACPQAQLSWRRSLDIKWPEDRIISMDAIIISQIINKGYWPVPCNEIIGQLYANHRGAISGRIESMNMEAAVKQPRDTPKDLVRL